MPYVRIIIRHTGHGNNITCVHFHCYSVPCFRIWMRLSGHWIFMNPIDLIQYGLFGNHLNIFINRCMQIIALLRRSYFRYSCSHITWIYRYALEAVLPSKFILILHLKAIDSYKFFLGICESWISIFCFISLSYRVIPFQIGR
ncbi:hypothetical protein D3C76_1526400 [compost metagenome]